MARVLILYHSVYGHIESVAQAEAEGARELVGTEVVTKRVPEMMSNEAVRKTGVKLALPAPVAAPDELVHYDAIIFGTPTRFGNMSGQMRNFLDQSGGLWTSGALIGKVGSVFKSSATQRGGHESGILTFHSMLLHLGMVVVGLHYSEQRFVGTDEIKGCNPYGASANAGGQGECKPTEQELGLARAQGKHVATIASKLCA